MPGAPRTNPSATRGAQADLAARLQQTATGLEGRLNRRDTLIELIRSVNGTLDPSEVGDALLGQAAEWFPADCLVVAIQDGSPEPLVIAQRGPCDQYEDALAGVARWIAEHGQYDCLMVVADLKVGTTKLVADLNLGATKLVAGLKVGATKTLGYVVPTFRSAKEFT